jgi:hypothetical protein
MSHLVVPNICFFCSLPLPAIGPNPITLDSTMFFWIYTFPSISHPSPHSLNPESQARRRLASLQYLSLSQMKKCCRHRKRNAIQAVDTQVMTLFSAKATPTVVLSYPRDHPFVHILYHGILELGKLGSDLRLLSNFHDTEGLFLEGDQVV